MLGRAGDAHHLADHLQWRETVIATIALGIVGGVIGAQFGDPMLGFQVGVAVGSAIDASAKQKTQSVGRLSDLRLTGSSYGVFIPQITGDFRLPGNIIWSTDLVETSKKKGSKTTGTQRIYSYTCSFAVMVCRGPASIRRIWAEDRTLYDMYAYPPAAHPLRVYRGDEQQQPDSLLVAKLGASFTPAYRGLCYVVFQDLPLAEWGNRLPNLSFEVAQTYPDLVLSQPSVQSYWRFDDEGGKLTDIGPKSFTLTDASPASTQVQGCFQLLNGAAGGGKGVRIGASSKQLTRVTGNVAEFQGPKLTVESWFKWQGTLGHGTNEIEWQNTVSGEYWELEIQPDPFNPTFIVNSVLNTTVSGVTIANTTTFTRDSNWHHAVWTYNQAGNSLLYIDGALVSTVAAPVNPMAIAANAANTLQLIGGDLDIDEVAIYSDTLAAADILAHYQEGAGLARTRTTPTVGTFLADLFAQEGLVSTQWDVSAATDPLDGNGITERQPARDAADPVLRVYNTLLCEYDGKIVAVKRGGAPVATIAAADLGAVVWNGSNTPTPKVEPRRLQDLELPFRVDVGYFSKYRKYEASHQGEERYTKTHLQDPLTVQTNLVFAADTSLSAEDKARQAAARILYQIWTEREQFTFSLPPAYLYLTPGDVVNLPVLGQTLRVRLTQVDVELPGPIHCTAVLDDASVLTQTVSGAAVITSGEEAADVLATTLYAWNGNALVDSDADSIGLYLSANGSTSGFWPGAEIYWSRDAGVSYQELAAVTDGATLGTAVTALATGTVAGAWDTTNTVDVTILNGPVPVTTSDADVIAGSNAALLGDEVIQFAIVTALGGSQYRLSRLQRGRRGSDGHWAEHRIGERFTLLDTGLTARLALTDDLLGRTVLLKAVTSGQTLGDVTAQTVYVGGDEKKPYAPCQLAGARDGPLNLTITWIRRTRKGAGLPSPLTIPLSETTEAYAVDILFGSPKTITAITAAAAPTINSTSHGFTNGQRVYFTGILGMTQLNGLIGTVSNALTNSFQLSDLSTLYFSAYVSGGTAERVVRSFTPTSPTQVYSAANQTSDFGSTQASVRVVITQTGSNGRGYPAFAVL